MCQKETVEREFSVLEKVLVKIQENTRYDRLKNGCKNTIEMQIPDLKS